MASITIHNLDDDLHSRLRVRAAQHRRSVEEEVRIILRNTVNGGTGGFRVIWQSFTRECFAHLGGVETRTSPRVDRYKSPPDFS